MTSSSKVSNFGSRAGVPAKWVTFTRMMFFLGAVKVTVSVPPSRIAPRLVIGRQALMTCMDLSVLVTRTAWVA